MFVHELNPIRQQRTREEALMMIFTRPVVTALVAFAVIVLPATQSIADESTKTIEKGPQNQEPADSAEFDISEFQNPPSKRFQPTDPDALFDSGSQRIGKASYQSVEPVIVDGPDGVNQAPIADGLHNPAEVFNEVPPIPGDSITVPRGSSPTVQAYDPESVESLKNLDKDESRLNLRRLADSPYQNYRVDESSWSWIPGTGDNFGWFSLLGSTYKPRGQETGFGGTINIHWLGGPTSVPLNPRLYDFALGFQTRDSLSPRFSYDLAASVGAYSDFEGSARDGVRFPAHAVGMIHFDQSTDLVFGIDYLDRDDYPLLPVFGFSLHNFDIPGLRMDLIFPRPRVEYALSPDSRAYLSGQLGGGMWEVEFPDQREHVMTYGDYRLILGFEKATDDNSLAALEFGYVFHRRLEFRDLPTQSFDDAFLIQWVFRR